VNKRRNLIVLAALIEHPDMGLILFETGCAEDIEVVRGLQQYALLALTSGA